MANIYFVGASIAAIFVSTSSYAQDIDQHGVEPVDEILVTARKREERIQDTPLAITAISGAALSARQIDSIAHVGQSVPNMTFQSGAPTGTGSSTPSIFIRGVGSNETSMGTEPGVGLYVDDVYLARSVGSVLDLVDIDSVQILRGPQGTLFGRNSVGGAILIRSERPTQGFEGSLQLKTGTGDRFDLKSSLNIPISETVRSRWSFLRSYQKGYVRSLDGDDFGDTNRIAGRGTIEWDVAPNFLMTFRFDGLRAQEKAAPTQILGFVSTIPGTPVQSSIQAIANLKGTCGGASVLANSGNGDCIDQQVILGPFRTAGGYSSTNEIFDSQGSQHFGNTSDLDIYGGSIHAEWDLSATASIKSISSYRSIEAFWVGNSDHSPNEAMETKNDLDQSHFTQELQLSIEDSRKSIVLGGFLMREKGTFLNVVMFPQVIFRSGGKYKTSSNALFAQVSYKLLESFEITAGLRYTEEKKTYDVVNNQQIIGILLDPVSRTFQDLRSTPIPFVTGSTPKITNDEFTPHVNLAYKLMGDLMLYASYSRGYKSGGYEQRLAPGTPIVPTFKPEYVDSFEIGGKVTALDGRFQASVAAFKSNYDDMQISVVDGPAPTLTNAGAATLKGAELEVSWRSSDMTFTAYASYLDARYDRLSDRAQHSGVSLDSKIPNAPRWQVGANITQAIISRDDFAIKANGEWNYRSTAYLDAQNTGLFRQGGYHLLNGGLTASLMNDKLLFSLLVRNILNRKFLVTGLAQYDIGTIEGQYARPREWSVGLKYAF